MDSIHATFARPSVATQGDSQLIDQLSRNSSPYHDPLLRVRWEQLNQNSFWLPEPAISLYGCPEYDKLSLEQRKTLSQFEFLNFIEAGIWLESLFMERIARSLGKQARNLAEVTYHLHEMREEAGHSLMFVELLRRSGPLLPNTRFHRFDISNVLARIAPFESVIFWTAVLIGEEVPDRMNRFVRKHQDAVNPAIFDIVSVHIIDEARHIAHAKDSIAQALSNASPLKRRLLSAIINRMIREFVRAFYLPGAHIYEMAGLAPGTAWAQRARNNLHRSSFIHQCTEPTLRTLRGHGLQLDWK
ncbi:MAG: diiron oxygenase [Gammaproteobacteria bacterium]|nr:diiron oxygenase [Gammaproteobacteria bacterium]